jgi:glycosyltransferase involved in cell wall biosynthesis
MEPTPAGSPPPTVSVSVIVPCLNGARFLLQALASIGTQPGVEVIVVDGGSTDGSVEMIRAWAAQRPFARWTSEADRGQADAINKGFAVAHGELVTWLNADDQLEPDTIARVAREFAADPELELVWGFCLVVDPQGKPLYVQNPFVREDFAQLRRHRNFVPQPGCFFRRALVERVGPLDISYHYMFDYEFFLRLAGRVHARFLPEVLARFRLHPDSKTSRRHREFLREERRAFRAHGGRLLSPFTLDLWRYRLISLPFDRTKAPVRRLIWKVMGLPVGSRIRP